MPRVKRGNKRKEYRKKILKRASGYFLTKSKLYQAAEEAVERGLKFAYSGRKQKKRQYRSIWIVRIGAAAKAAQQPELSPAREGWVEVARRASPIGATQEMYKVSQLDDFSPAAIDRAATELTSACDAESQQVKSDADYKAFRDRWLAR